MTKGEEVRHSQDRLEDIEQINPDVIIWLFKRENERGERERNAILLMGPRLYLDLLLPPNWPPNASSWKCNHIAVPLTFTGKIAHWEGHYRQTSHILIFLHWHQWAWKRWSNVSRGGTAVNLSQRWTCKHHVWNPFSNLCTKLERAFGVNCQCWIFPLKSSHRHT